MLIEYDFIADMTSIMFRTFKLKFFKKIRPIEVKMCYVLWALKRINKPKIGEIVYHKGRVGVLLQGVKAPYWDIYFSEGNELNNFTIVKHIHENDFRLKPLWRRFKTSFETSYNFQIGYWYTIDIYNPLGCGISYM
jgi:hypothetical protein